MKTERARKLKKMHEKSDPKLIVGGLLAMIRKRAEQRENTLQTQTPEKFGQRGRDEKVDENNPYKFGKRKWRGDSGSEGELPLNSSEEEQHNELPLHTDESSDSDESDADSELPPILLDEDRHGVVVGGIPGFGGCATPAAEGQHNSPDDTRDGGAAKKKHFNSLLAANGMAAASDGVDVGGPSPADNSLTEGSNSVVLYSASRIERKQRKKKKKKKSKYEKRDARNHDKPLTDEEKKALEQDEKEGQIMWPTIHKHGVAERQEVLRQNFLEARDDRGLVLDVSVVVPLLPEEVDPNPVTRRTKKDRFANMDFENWLAKELDSIDLDEFNPQRRAAVQQSAKANSEQAIGSSSAEKREGGGVSAGGDGAGEEPPHHAGITGVAGRAHLDETDDDDGGVDEVAKATHAATVAELRKDAEMAVALEEWFFELWTLADAMEEELKETQEKIAAIPVPSEEEGEGRAGEQGTVGDMGGEKGAGAKRPKSSGDEKGGATSIKKDGGAPPAAKTEDREGSRAGAPSGSNKPSGGKSENITRQADSKSSGGETQTSGTEAPVKIASKLTSADGKSEIDVPVLYEESSSSSAADAFYAKEPVDKPAEEVVPALPPEEQEQETPARTEPVTFRERLFLDVDWRPTEEQIEAHKVKPKEELTIPQLIRELRHALGEHSHHHSRHHGDGDDISSIDEAGVRVGSSSSSGSDSELAARDPSLPLPPPRWLRLLHQMDENPGRGTFVLLSSSLMILSFLMY